MRKVLKEQNLYCPRIRTNCYIFIIMEDKVKTNIGSKSYSIRSQGFHNDNDFIILIHREGKCNFTNQQICPLSPQNREEAELTTSLPSENAGSGTRHSRPSTLGGIHIINEPYGLK